MSGRTSSQAVAVAAAFAIMALLALPANADTRQAEVLRRGDTGGYVATWQRILNQAISDHWYSAVGYGHLTPIHVDGMFDQPTERMTRMFDKGAHIASTDVVDANTWKAWWAGQLTANACIRPVVLLRMGSSGPCVGFWQIGLNRWLTRKYPTTAAPLVNDGAFGPLTLAATLAYQRAHGLAADGVVGTDTWREAERSDLLHLP
jgi:peptidoglycan hydrolase-like protein with peptidoglycan-binding domain